VAVSSGMARGSVSWRSINATASLVRESMVTLRLGLEAFVEIIGEISNNDSSHA